MGITVIHKSDLSETVSNPRTALVLAGGAVSGGAFKVGGLVALNSYMKNVKVHHFDVFTGISAGSMIAAPLAAGIPIEEVFKGLFGMSERVTTFTEYDFYYPNVREYLSQAWRFARDSMRLVPDLTESFTRLFFNHRKELSPLFRRFMDSPNLGNAQLVLAPFMREVLTGAKTVVSTSYWPSGVCNNKRIERYIRVNMERNRLPNHFRLLKRLRGKDLYVVATDLNRGETAVFGWDEDTTLTISEAVQASTALPVLYRPARVGGREFVDAAVLKTANVSLAVQKKADLIIAYNPFRPLVVQHHGLVDPRVDGLGQKGVFSVLNQAFRTMLHRRLQESLDRIREDPEFKGDIVLFEPVESDTDFFSTNPIAFWRLGHAAEHGFESVKDTIEQNHDQLRPIFHRYGIEVDLTGLRQELSDIQAFAEREDDEGMVRRMGTKQVARRLRQLRVVQ